MSKIHIAICEVKEQYIAVANSKIYEQEYLDVTGTAVADWSKPTTNIKSGRYWAVTPIDCNGWVHFDSVPAVGNGWPIFKGVTSFFAMDSNDTPSVVQVAVA